MRKIFSSKTRWFVALLLAATLVFGFSSCSSDSDDDDDSTSSSSSNSSAPSASDLAGIKLSDKNASSLSALQAAGQTLDDNDEPEGAWIVAFNSSGTSGYGYDYEGNTADAMTWTKYAIAYDASTGILSVPNSTDSDDDTTMYLVKTSSGFALCPVSDSEDDNFGTSLSEVFGTGYTLSDGKIYYSGVQAGTYSESGNLTSITMGSETSYLIKISGYYYLCVPLYTYSGDLPS
ncbi:MAG: hypothetical protein II811_00210 [Spirochaetaceae bacterium]|nr:hypothetical protein [Spirochaetaceae bacterium]